MFNTRFFTNGMHRNNALIYEYNTKLLFYTRIEIKNLYVKI